METEHQVGIDLNTDITMEEIEKVTTALKNGQSIGVDIIPNETLWNKSLYLIPENACFQLGLYQSNGIRVLSVQF